MNKTWLFECALTDDASKNVAEQVLYNFTFEKLTE